MCGSPGGERSTAMVGMEPRSPGGEKSTAMVGIEPRCVSFQVEKDPQPKWEWKPGVPLSRCKKIHIESGNRGKVCRSADGERSTSKVGMEPSSAAVEVDA